MKRILSSAAFVALLAAAAWQQAASQPNLVRELAPGVFFREAERDKRIIANTGWVVFRDYVLVIDANFPWGARAILPDIRKTTAKPVRFVFNTHYHGDHAFGSAEFVAAGAAVICSRECTEESLQKNPAGWARSAELRNEKLEHPQLSFQDRLVLDDGERRVELIRMGPGHTRGDAVAWLPREKILFTGDLCVNSPGNNVADADANPDNWVRALDAMADWPVVHLVPGHGDLGDARTLRGQRAYLAAMIDGVRAGLARGASADDIAGSIDFSRHVPFGRDPARNAASVKAIFARFAGK
jgi:glyoxylase-like metal-dependent hydrolase (beta-lactamase superfamily II)